MTKLFTALLLLSCLSVAQSLFWGPCPQVSVKPDFDITSYPGTWYEIARYPTHSPESEDVRCVQGVYGTSDKPNYVTVKNSGIEPDGSITQVVGEAWIPDEDEPGKLLVRFSRYQPPGDYWVLDTDYDRYTLVHSCQNKFFFFHTQMDWILSRYRSLDEATLETVYGIFDDNDVKTGPLVYTNQEGCDSNTIVVAPAE